MGPINAILNQVNTLNDQNIGFFRKQIQSRATHLLVIAPIESAETIKNIFTLPVQSAGAILKGASKAAALVTGSEAIKKFEEKLPGLKDLLCTICKVFTFAIGAFLSATVGVLYPKINYNLHCALGLALDPKREKFNANSKYEELMTYQLTDNKEPVVEGQENSNHADLGIVPNLLEETKIEIKDKEETTCGAGCEAIEETIGEIKSKEEPVEENFFQEEETDNEEKENLKQWLG